jgi:trans-AT polyketide synthase/acyltransferase/oxidoreductase domain-containing protein
VTTAAVAAPVQAPAVEAARVSAAAVVTVAPKAHPVEVATAAPTIFAVPAPTVAAAEAPEVPARTYLFPGQGAQRVGMGKDLFASYPREVALADSVLGYSIVELCTNDPARQLTNTLFAQPAMYVVNCLSYLRLRDQGAEEPTYFAGHSVGELAALFAAGAFSFEDGLRIVQWRAELMARANGGGMLAVLGLDLQEVQATIDRHGLGSIDVANLNTPTQIVVSGPAQDLPGAKVHFEKAGATAVIPLKVSGAFHSRYMADASREFAERLRAVRFADRALPVISNVTAQPYGAGQVARLLTEQIASPVRWCESIQRLMGIPGMEFVQVGPGDVVKGLAERIRSEAHPLSPPAMPAAVGAAPPPVSPIRPTKRAGRDEPDGTAAPLAFSLGDPSFCREYGVRMPYVAGAMYKGIASVSLVVRMANAGLLAFYGSGGQRLDEVAQAIADIQRQLRPGASFGMNLLSTPSQPKLEAELVELYLQKGIVNVEAAAYTEITPGLVKYRLRGLTGSAAQPVARHKIIAKVSHPGVAHNFMLPAPESLVQQLWRAGEISEEQARLSREVPLADDICAEADSGGHTDQKTPLALLPSILALRDRTMKEARLCKRVRVGAAGGIGTPTAVAAAFMMGADFIVTGSINQCTVEAGTHDVVKDMLATLDIHDTTMAPSGDRFESGAQIQVMKKGVFFPPRARKLFELYRQHASLDEIDEATRHDIERKYFGRSFDEVYEETRRHYASTDPKQLARAERDPKHKMALVFRWYFVHTNRLARAGESSDKTNFQVHCGPALGAFNQWVKATRLEDWRHRHVDEIADLLMKEATQVLTARLEALRGRELGRPELVEVAS